MGYATTIIKHEKGKCTVASHDNVTNGLADKGASQLESLALLTPTLVAVPDVLEGLLLLQPAACCAPLDVIPGHPAGGVPRELS